MQYSSGTMKLRVHAYFPTNKQNYQLDPCFESMKSYSLEIIKLVITKGKISWVINFMPKWHNASRATETAKRVVSWDVGIHRNCVLFGFILDRNFYTKSGQTRS